MRARIFTVAHIYFLLRAKSRRIHRIAITIRSLSILSTRQLTITGYLDLA